MEDEELYIVPQSDLVMMLKRTWILQYLYMAGVEKWKGMPQAHVKLYESLQLLLTPKELRRFLDKNGNFHEAEALDYAVRRKELPRYKEL